MDYHERQKAKEIIRDYFKIPNTSSDSALINAEEIKLNLKEFLEISEEYMRDTIISENYIGSFRKLKQHPQYKKIEEELNKIKEENYKLASKINKINKRI